MGDCPTRKRFGHDSEKFVLSNVTPQQYKRMRIWNNSVGCRDLLIYLGQAEEW
jgi:hypothetical protein